MKIAKFFAGIFGAIGTVLLVGSLGLCLFFRNAPARVGQIPQGAEACAAALEAAIAEGDADALENCIYGQPELGLAGEPREDLSDMVWELLEANLEFSWQGECYAQNGAWCRDGSVRYLEAASVTRNLQTRAHTLLTQRVEEATVMEDLYDETGEFRQDLVEQVMQTALVQACMEDAEAVTAEVTVQFIHRDGQWWAVPDKALLTALSGGLA